MKYVSFPWPPLEAALPILNVSLFFSKNNFLGTELLKTKDVSIIVESKISKNVCLEQIRSVVQ
jgi:hypothetical protein